MSVGGHLLENSMTEVSSTAVVSSLRSLLPLTLALTMVVGCSGDPAPLGGTARCVGPSCAEDVDEAGGDAGGDADDGDASPEADSGDGGVDPTDQATLDGTPLDGDEDSCPGITNRCGGCDSLDGLPGGSCGLCDDGTWECNGLDAVVCFGASEGTLYYEDVDLDGFGNPDQPPYTACEEPSQFWVTNQDDCDDNREDVNPDAVEVCNGRDDDCDDHPDEAPDDSPDCADACCDDVRICDDGRCLIPCAAQRCGRDLELCCGAGEVCYAENCVPDDVSCDFTEDCALGEFCEPTLEICITREIVPECEFRPERGEFDPRVGCRWTPEGLDVDAGRDDVVATPIVINLSDDNEDGSTDAADTPDIVFLTYNLASSCCNVAATLRIVSGQCNDDGTMNTLASINTPVMTNDTGLAAADLVGDDGVPEIVAVGMYGRDSDDRPGGTIAFQRTADDGSAWEVAWTNEEYPTWNVHTRGGPAISIADLTGDGKAEVIIGNVALNGQTGELLWDGNVENEGSVGIGNNAFLGPSSAVADIDLDGFMEVAAGNTLYDHEGQAEWTFDYTTNNSTCGGDLPCDGFSAVANFDDDDEGEVVIIRRGEVFILEHTGEELWRQAIPTKESNPCSYNESGPPTIADFDGDGRNEVGTAAADYYVVADMDCDPDEGPVPDECQSRGILWRVRNADCSSRVTASSVFDFEGDGAAEVVYADETNFRIYDGRDGSILFDDPTHGSHTRLEMPVIADVDNDGNAEIVIPENGSRGGTPGVEVWADRDDNWVRTRRVWNQHGYSITHIRESGTVPARPDVNWLNPRLNNWRQNVQPDGLFDAPDLQILDLSVDVVFCRFQVEITVLNAGSLNTPPGLPVTLTASHPELGDASLTVATETRLFPGQTEIIALELPPPVAIEERVTYSLTAVVDPDNLHNECEEDNNAESVDADYICLIKN